MKKLYRPLCFVAAVAAMSLTSCQKENFNPAGEGETVTITVHANVEDVANATKTHIEGTQVLWDENEEMKVIAFNNADPENTGSESVSTEFTPSADFTTATFKAAVSEGKNPDRIAGVYPADAAVGLGSVYGKNVNATSYKVELSAAQSATADSYDPASYIMIARADAYPLENGEWTAYYKRATALNCMTLSGITDEIKSVTVTFPEGQQAAGRRYYNLATGEAGEIYHEPTNVVTVNYATPLKAGNGENDVWFTSWNVNVKTGESITVKAESATKIYTKTLTATKKDVALMENYLNIFPFDMTGAEVENATEATGDGTLENPYNVAAALDLIATSGGTESEVYVKGFITEIDEVSTSFGNATYFISDDKEGSNRIEVFRGKYLEESNFTSEDQIAVGDEVIVVGGLENYNGTYEISQNNYIYSHNGKTELDGPSAGSPGSAERPYTVAEAFEAITTSGITQKVYVEGTISSIDEVSTQFGNATYDISDDGSTQGDQLTVFRGYYLDNERFTSVDQINVGDKVIVFGNLVNYNGTYEFNSDNYIYSLNGSASQPELSVSSKAVTVSADETEVVFEYTARNLTGDVSATVASDESQIISGSPVVDAAASTVTVTLNPNTDEVEKTATITLTTEGVEPVTLTITQRAYVAAGTEGTATFIVAEAFSSTPHEAEISPATIDGITISGGKGDNTNMGPKRYNDEIRMYYYNTLTVSGDSGVTITSINFTISGSNIGYDFSADTGEYSNGNWTGSSNSVTFTNGKGNNNKQFRTTQIVVKYTK